ncbi:MAG: hypothetical protein ABIW31_02815 [Novosphingobium sp.]
MRAVQVFRDGAFSALLAFGALLFVSGSEQAQAQAQPQPQAAGASAANDAAAVDPPIGSIDLTVTVPHRMRCGTSNGRGEIVVCGADHGDDVRVPSTADSDPNSKEGQNTGLPQAPSVSGLPDCRKSKCHGFGRAPPRIYVIDMKSIPEAPKGSDADRVAKGEISDR